MSDVKWYKQFNICVVVYIRMPAFNIDLIQFYRNISINDTIYIVEFDEVNSIFKYYTT